MLTPQQKAHVEKINPAVAKRWDSRGIPPKKRTAATDFKNLVPNQKARHRISPMADEKQPMAEGHGIKFLPGSRGNRLDKFKRKAS
jgi:hypothetical protein